MLYLNMFVSLPSSLQATEVYLFIAALLLLLSVIASKFSDRIGIPSLLLFLLIGMLAGSEGIGGIYFDDPWIAKSLGITALIFILFIGGLETKIKDIKNILWQGISLSTLGVLITAFIISFFAVTILKFSFLDGFLLGAIISSTDAAAVLNILRSRTIALKGNLKSLLEFESGSNDPMAVFLTLGTISFLTIPDFSGDDLLIKFILEVSVGLGMGYLMSKTILFVINHLQLAYDGLYPVLTIALVILTYSLTTFLKGNGFLAVYLCGLLLEDKNFLHKKTILHFNEGLAWLMQIAMFLTLGLLVFPSQIPPVAGSGLLISFALMFIARPVSTFVCLTFSKMNFKEKILISWVGLRGAVPIILATFPLIVGLPKAGMIFNIVFFIVLTSILLQGTSVPLVSRLLKLNTPLANKRVYPLELEQGILNANLEEVIIPYNSGVIGKKIFEIGIPESCLVVLLCRNEKFLIPIGTTALEGGDVLLVLAEKQGISEFQKILTHSFPLG